MPIKTKTRVTVDGFGDEQTDFLVALTAAGEEVSTAFASEIAEPLIAALNSTNEVVILSVIGLADRDDSDGLTQEQRRAKELQISQDRVDSAIQHIEGLIVASVAGYEPGNWEENQQFAIGRFAVGASNLVETDEELTEEQRKRNRAVTLSMLRFAYE